MPLFLIRYGEIALKSPRVRRRFENALVHNVEEALLRAKLEGRVERGRGRLFLRAEQGGKARDLLAHTFGIVSTSPVDEVKANLKDASAAVLARAETLLAPDKTFAIRVRRTGTHPFTSMEFARDVGAAVIDAWGEKGVKVNLTDPDVEIFVEVRDNTAYVFSEKHPGPGGMPVGTQGKVLALISNENDAMAAWLIARRGCRVRALTRNPDLLDSLRTWQGTIKTYEGDPGDMEAIKPALARAKAEGIVVGTTFDDFSERLDLSCLTYPVFYPLVGMDETMLEELRTRIQG